MKSQYSQKIILALVTLTLPMLTRAANVSLKASDASGTTSMTTVGQWGTDSTGHAALPPQATNDYFTGQFFMRTPPTSGAAQTYTFAGHSLTLSLPVAGGARNIIFKGVANDVIVINNLTNAFGGILENGGSGNVLCTYTGNLFTIAANSAVVANQGPMIVGYPLAGADGVVLTNAGGNAGGITYSNNNSAFTGKFYTTTASFGNGGGNTTIILAATNSAPGNPAIFTPDQIMLAGGCTLRDNFGLTLNNANGGITLGGNSTINAANATIPSVIAEPITDNGSNYVLTSSGTGVLVLSNAYNTYGGGTTISAGTLKMGVANVLTNNGSVTDNGGILDLNTFNLAIGGLGGSGGTVDTLAGGTPTLTVGGGDRNGTFSGRIQNTAGTLSLTKVGAGTETLSGGYTYSGQTLVTGGTLSLNTAASLPATAGNLAVSSGGILVVNATNGTALPANSVIVGTNGTLNLSSSSAANGINAAGSLTYQDNATNSFIYGNLSANPTVAAINVLGGISAPGTNIVINVNAFGLKPGQFPLVKYTGTTLGGIANFTLGSVPPGVVATLANNTGNHSIDLNVSSAPNQLAWNGVIGTSWDTTTANWTNAFNGTITVYQEYAGGTAGDIVTFDDTLASGNPQPTNINLTAVFHPFPVIVNSTVPYTIGGAGGLAGSSGNTGLPYLTKNNTGSITLLTSNSFTGGLAINAGTVIITNDFSLGASSSPVSLNGGTLQVNGNTADSARTFSVPATSTIGVRTNVVAQFGGATGAGGLTKTDDGTLVMAGSNGITGTLTVNQGNLTVLGTNVLPAVPLVGNVSGLNGVLTVAGGSIQANNNGGSTFSTSLTIGNLSGAGGDMVMNSGSLIVNRQLTVGGSAYGGYNQSGGAARIGGFIACGGTGSGGVFNQTGGTVAMNGAAVTIGYGANTTFGVMNLGGNAVFNMIGNGNGVWPGEVGNGTLNVSGNAALSITNDGVSLGRNNGTGTVNLNGGAMTVNFITNGPVAGTFNFNGGILRANANGTFTKGTVSTAFYDYSGAVIDDGGNTITFTKPIHGVTGHGVGSVTLVDGGSGYIDTPIVTVVDDSQYGTNATATAQVDPVKGTITNIVITCPGSGYDNIFSSISLTFTGGGANAVPPSGVSGFTFVANGAGGLTKQGSGTVTLTGVNTFAGPITNNAGTLVLNSASTYSGAVVNAGNLSLTTASALSGPTTVSNGATLSVSQIGTNTASLNNLTFNGGAAAPGATLGVGVTGLNPTVPLVNCGTLTVEGTNSINLNGAVVVGNIPLVKYTGALGGSGNITNLILPQGVAGYVSNSAASSTLYAVITSTGPGLVWTGTNSVAALTNLWDINSTTNWLIFSTPTAYHQSIIPGDAVTFNDSGSGTVILKTNVGPSGVVISNNSISYTFKGAGTITGPGGITKLGSGTATLNLTNNSYVGDTVISNGTLQFGIASALPSTANLNIGPSGTLELAGLSPTVGELTGSGIIDNHTGLNPILTVGSSAGGTWNGTIQDHGGGVALHKVGSGIWVVGGINHLNDGQPFNDQSLITAGTVVITNGGLLSVSDVQLQIANGAGSAASVVVAGGTLAVTNNVLSVGYGSSTANGTLTVNSGTVFHGGPGGGAFAAVGVNCIDVGGQGATGTLTVNGGQVLNNSELILGDGATSVGTLHLNGGLLQAVDIRPNGSPTASPVAYFNGGTLQAVTNSANFMQVLGNVMGGGLILDDNGYTLSISGGIFYQGDLNNGGLFKKGSGTVYLDTPNQYTGLTVVTNGTLAGVGSVNGPVLVTAGGNLGSGDAAGITPGTPFTILNSGNLTLQGNATMRISKNGGTRTQDSVTVSGNANYGGTLTINNVTSDGTPLANGDTFQVFNVTGSKSGSFSSIVGFGATYSFDASTGIVTVLSTGPGVFTNPTGITSFKLSGANVVITATNGQSGGAYYLLESTNVAQPLSHWASVATNILSVNGNYTFVGTNVVAPGGLQQFYILSNTNN